MGSFNRFLVNTLFASISTNTVWFALVFWIYLELGSLTISSIVAAMFPLLSALFGVFFGSVVDSRSKKTSIIVSSALSFCSFMIAGLIFSFVAVSDLLVLTNPILWIWVTILLVGTVSNNLRMIALSTLVTELVETGFQAKANGRVGVVNGISFALTSVFSGLLIGSVGMGWTLWLVVCLSMFILIDSLVIPYNPKSIPSQDSQDQGNGSLASLGEGFRYMYLIPGLFTLVLFTTFNNFLGGVFMSLSDPYGLELVSVQMWGFVWGGLSVMYIVGGWLVSTKGLGKLPLQTLMIANAIIWGTTILFPIYSNIWVSALGFGVYMLLFPYIEAAEQTIIQKVVEPSKQGRVFGIAQSIEMLASPVTAVIIGPLTQFVILPNLQEGTGYDVIGIWFGTTNIRAIALVFILSGVSGLIATYIAIKSKAYDRLNRQYIQSLFTD